MTLLITGANGFVGKNIIENDQFSDLRKICIVRKASRPNDITWDEFFQSGKLVNGDVILHLAGKAHDLRGAANPQEYFEVNTDLSIKLYNTFLVSQASTFIYMSSVKAVADSIDEVLTEDTQAKPLTPYGQSKHRAEDYLLKAPLPIGKRVFILRPCMIHGPGNKGNLNLLYKVVKNGIPYPLAAFTNKRSFLSIDNLLYILARIINDVNVPGGIYNLADDEPLSTNELIRIIAHASEKKPRLWALPKMFIKGLSSIGDKLHLPLNTERLTKLTESYQVSNQKIKQALNIIELPTPANKGLYNTIKSFTNQA